MERVLTMMQSIVKIMHKRVFDNDAFVTIIQLGRDSTHTATRARTEACTGRQNRKFKMRPITVIVTQARRWGASSALCGLRAVCAGKKRRRRDSRY